LTKTQKKEVEKQVKKEIRILKKTQKLGSEFKKHTSTALITALGLVIALTWKDFILAAITHFTKVENIEKYPYIADLYTVIVVTIFGAIGLIIVSKWAQNSDETK